MNMGTLAKELGRIYPKARGETYTDIEKATWLTPLWALLGYRTYEDAITIIRK